MLLALEQIRRMRGGAQSHLMRCSDGNYYVVKFQNNPQHPRILVNEMLGTRVASRLGLPTTPVDIVYVCEELIRLTSDLWGVMRKYCSQVWRQAKLWDKIEKSIRVGEFAAAVREKQRSATGDRKIQIESELFMATSAKRLSFGHQAKARQLWPGRLLLITGR
jgi:hypothetical protein